jgi:phosphonoacetate hydrolase
MMTRREFLAASVALVSRKRAVAAPNRKVLFICMDGCDPRYLELSDTPNLKRMMREGMYREGRSMMPSVTNVNNASIATMTFPREHGITANYYYDRATRQSTYMESPDFLLRPTIFSKARTLGYRTAFVSSKDKLRELIGKSSDIAVSAEDAPRELESVVGPKADVYSAELNYWSFRCTQHLLRSGYNFIFLSTTDYMMHTYAPEEAPSQEHMHQVDKLLGEIAGDHPSIEIYMTADHGMNAKTKGIDLTRLLAREGIEAVTVSVGKDRYVKHHRTLSGASYVYLNDARSLERTAGLLRRHESAEEVLSNSVASERFQLKSERIGDLMVLARENFAYGELENAEEDVHVRTHGSLHETKVPILCYGRKVDPKRYEYNMDITRRFDWDV